MRNRFIAAVLSLTLCASALSISASAASDNPAFTPDNPPAAQETTAPESSVKPDPEGTVSYANLEQRMRENNPTVRMLQANIEVINDIDYEKMYDDLRKGMSGIAQMQWGMLGAGNADAMHGVISPTITNGYISGTLDAQYDSLRDTFEDLKSGELQKDHEAAKRQLQNAQEQVIMGAETLYIAILEMQNTRAGLQRQLEALDRTAAEMAIRHKYGQVSALNLQQVENGRIQLASGIATLDMNIENYTCQLEVMLGLSPTGTLKLSEIPEISKEQVDEMTSMEDALSLTKEKSYELYEADKTLEEAEETFRESKRNAPGLQSMEYKQAVHTYDAAKFSHQATVQNFELSFRTMYTAVGNYRQVLDAAESALDYQRNDLAATELKYKHGSISLNTLLEARDALATAEESVLTAKHNLFTAYHNYQLAVEHGILN